MNYACPFANTKRGTKACLGQSGTGFPTVRGWKGHMSRSHDGYDEKQLAAIVGAVETDPVAGRAAFLAESDSPSVDTPGVGKEAAVNTDGEGVAGQGRPTVQPPEPVKRVPLKSERFLKFLNTLPEKIFKEKGIELDDEDKEMMATGTEMMEGLFGVAFEVPESIWVIRSRWMALLFPLGAIALVYLKHTFSLAALLKKDDGTTPIDEAVKKARDNAS